MNVSENGPYLVAITGQGIRVPLDFSALDANQWIGSLTSGSLIWDSLVALESGFEMESATAKLNVTAFMFLRPVQFHDNSMDPARIKIDIRLVRSLVSDNSLAVVTRVVSQEVGIIHEGGFDWGGVRATADGITSFFTWDSSALIDGRTQSVGVTTEQLNGFEEYSARVVFAYPPGALVVHDPQLGFDLAAGASRAGPETLLTIGIVSILVVVAPVAVWMLQRKLHKTR